MKRFLTGMSTSSSRKEEEIGKKSARRVEKYTFCVGLSTVACAFPFHRRFGFP